MNPTNPSNRVLPTIYGYEYDPVLNRFFKSPASNNSHRTQSGSDQTSQTNYPQDGAPPSYKFRAPTSIHSRRLAFDPEIDPPSISNRFIYNTRIRYRELCLQSAKPILLATSNNDDQITGNICKMKVTPFEAGNPERFLILATTRAQVFLCKLETLIHEPESLRWEKMNLPQCNPADLILTTSIAYQPDIICLGSSSGCTFVNLLSCCGDLPHLFYDHSKDWTTWCLSCNTPKMLIGTEKKLVVYDYFTGECLSHSPKTCVLDIEARDEFNSILGSRSGNIIHHDLRIANEAKRNRLAAAGSIFKLKLLNDNEILVVGALNYAKVHDLRYLTSDPTMTLDEWQNLGDQSFGFTVSQDKSLVCMAGRDQTIKIWDLKSNPNPGLGLSPIVTHHTTQPVKCVTFIDDIPSAFWSPGNIANERARVTVKPNGPGILFDQGSALNWLGPTAA